ncbi:hotdog fold thioesterase [Blastococcus sp. Marseille-P5729]|uniref:hotdog fold thioesterase n=1 Tax=Blastococcus sp. Marseille-P5729 TaxID=2086582 RepID=UPI000D0E438A|nr:hotdog fold thioesterase [Blastococcus sp. Marseille-P5729]
MPIDFPNQHIADMVAADRAAEWLTVQPVSIRTGAATVELTVAEHMCNGHGTCHGGVLFTLADIALSYASNSVGALNVAAHADIQYVTPAQLGQRLRATATERMRYGRSGRNGIYDIPVTVADTGELVAIFTGRVVQVAQRSERGS